MNTRIIAVIVCMVSFHILCADDKWIESLPNCKFSNPPYYLGGPPANINDVPTQEIKHIDVIKVNDEIIYITWCGRIFKDQKAAIKDFVSANAAFNKLKGKDMYDITNLILIRFIGKFSEQEFTIISGEINTDANRNYYYYPGGSILLFNNMWKGDAE